MTALRWRGILTRLGHSVAVMHGPAQDDSGCDAVVALHAIRSGEAINRFRESFPQRPILVVLTGTDFFQPGELRPVLDRSLQAATRVIVLQNHLALQLPEEILAKTRVIFQSFSPPAHTAEPDTDCVEVCVLGHLRTVKDPLLAARACGKLPPESLIRVTQVGGALEEACAQEAAAESRHNPRYRWLGELPRSEAIQVLARCRVLVQSSLAEGGPSAVSEAVALGIPVLSTPTSGVVGLLGEQYPGYFPFSDAEKLASLMYRFEKDPAFRNELLAAANPARVLVSPEREATSWKQLLEELAISAGK